MSHEFDRTKIEQLIVEAKRNRAEFLKKSWAPALKKTVVGVLILVAAVLPSLKAGSDS